MGKDNFPYICGMKLKKKISYSFVTLIIISVLLLISGFAALNSKINTNEDIILVIEKNMSVNQILNELNNKNVLTPNIFYKYVIKIYANLTNAKLYVGVHKFNHNLTNWELIRQLFSLDNLLTTKITFPEGITIYRFASILQSKISIDSIAFINYCNDATILQRFGIEANNLEGYLRPATYTFNVGIDIMDILDLLIKEQIKELNKYTEDIQKSKYTRHQILTLASIIEAETPVIAERKRVSGVYHNRLNKQMLLQADPTLQYIFKERKKRILYSDLTIDNPYNTYKYVGLPPGPINSPSASSIAAAVFPEKHNYYYFVATGDGTNKHNFATSHSEHLKYKEIYKRNVSKGIK